MIYSKIILEIIKISTQNRQIYNIFLFVILNSIWLSIFFINIGVSNL